MICSTETRCMMPRLKTVEQGGEMAACVFKLFFLLFLPSASFTINITLRCWEDVTEFLSDLNAENPKVYALKMYDSVGKASSNVLSGNVDRLGSYTECISTKAPSGRFQGQYCKLQVQQDRIDYYNGICVPDSCNEEEVTELAIQDAFKFRTISFLLPFPSPFAWNSTVLFTEVARCSKGLFPIDAFVGICLFLSIFIIILSVVGTIYNANLWKKVRPNEFPSDSVNSANYGSTSSSQIKLSTSKAEIKLTCESESPLLDTFDESKQGVLDSILKCFSLQKNLPAIWPTKASQEISMALNGIKALSLLWIISGHTSQITAWQNLDNVSEWESKVLKNPIYIFSLSGPFYLGVDSFFLISGLLSCRSFLNLLDCSGKRITFQIAMKHLWNRLLRLQPLHLYSVSLLVALYSVTPWRSLWEFSKLEVDNCRQVWWTNLLLINNFISGQKSCSGWTWYLADDFQFSFTTPLLVFCSTKAKHWLFGLVTLLFLSTFTVTALLSFLYRLPVANPHDMRKTSTVMYFTEYYSKPYCRYGPFLVGILLGLFIYSQQTSILRNKVQASFGWLSAMVSMFMVVALAYTLEDASSSYSPIIAMYQALHRTVWAMAVSWIIFACEEGYGGFVNKVLSWAIWTALANISYACYLVHPMLILLYNGLQETFTHYSDLNMLYLFLGHSLTTLVVGLVLTVMVEMPLQELKRSWAHMRQQVV